jgi:hypothetical protein
MERNKSAARNGDAALRPRLARAYRIAAAVGAIVIAAGLSGCAGISQKFAEGASQAPGIGLPAAAPARPAAAPAYPAVHDIPPPRNSVVLTNFEQQKLEDDLVAARDHQQGTVGVPLQPKKKSKQAEKPQQTVAPVSSSRSIY